MNLKGRKFENARLGMEIYVYNIDGKEWFMATEICKLLKHTNASKAVSDMVWGDESVTKHIDLIELERGITNGYTLKKINSSRTFVTEVGLYQLTFRSRLDKAREFQKWVFEEVLPSLRKNNFYVDNENITSEQISELEKEIKKLKIEKGILHEIVYDISDATTMSFTEVSRKLFKKDARYLKKILIEYKFLDKDGYTPLIKEANFKLHDGSVKKMRIFTSTNVEKCRKGDDIRYNKITNFGYMYLKKYFNRKGLSYFEFNRGDE